MHDPSNYLAQLPKHVLEILKKLELEKIQLTLIGGAVRDYLINGKITTDLDFEVRIDSKSKSELEKKFEKSGLKFEKNKFGIYTSRSQEFELEFSIPRIERYEQKESYGHSDLDFEHDLSLSYEQSFLRRDLTLNAMGFQIDNESIKFIDPFNGLTHIQNRELFSCSLDFIKDPVRFLRAFRFALLFGFKFSKALEEQLLSMNLTQLSSYYFFYEGFKSKNILKFYSLINNFLKNKYLGLNENFICILKNAQQLIFSELIPQNNVQFWALWNSRGFDSKVIECLQVSKKKQIEIVNLLDGKSNFNKNLLNDKDADFILSIMGK